MNCPYCGQGLSEDAQVCFRCGAQRTAEPSPSSAWAGHAIAPPVSVRFGQVRTNGLAVASLVLGIVWLCWVGSILALIFGYTARGQIDRSAGTEAGRAMATAGIILGWVGMGFLALYIVLAAIGSTLDNTAT